MAPSINPIFPVIAAQGAPPDVVLQPGTLIDAQVLKVLANDLVRIAVANLSVDVFSEIPLQVGQALRLAVSQTPEGIKLALVGQALARGSEGMPASAIDSAVSPDFASPNLVSPAGVAPVRAGAKPIADAMPLKNPPTPLQALAVSAAAQSAATRQGSLAPLFANLSAVAGSDALSPKLQQAIAQLLALRPDLDENLSGSEVKAAFKNSGLFLESSLASESAPSSSPGGVPDLKAALIVLRQTLLSLGNPTAPENPVAPAEPALQQLQPPARASPDISATAAAPQPQTAASPGLAPSLNPEIDVEEVFLPQARLPVADDASESNATDRVFNPGATPPNADPGTRAAVAGATLNLLQEALQEMP